MKLLATSRVTILAVIAVCLLGVTCYGQKDVDDTSNKCAITQKSSEGWKRYYLEGPNGDAICVYLPKKPDKFPGGKLRGGNTAVTADVYLVSDDQEIYTVAFLYDLPTKTEDMSDAQKAEIFFGTWRGTIEHDRLALEKMSRTPVDVKYAEQNKVNVMGHEGRVQLFKVGPYLGQARIVFVEKKAYMLMGLWPPDRAQKRSSAFFNYFEMRVKQ
jgi:hypothetical protein